MDELAVAERRIAFIFSRARGWLVLGDRVISEAESFEPGAVTWAAVELAVTDRQNDRDAYSSVSRLTGGFESG